MLNGSTLNFSIDIQSSSPLDCIGTLVVFDNVTQYFGFIDSGTWTQSYIQFCIRNNTSVYNLIANQSSYYYTGLLFKNPSTVVDKIEFGIVGTVYLYDTDRFMLACSILSTSTTSCTFQLSDLDVQGLDELCVLGSIPSLTISSVPIRNVLINYSTESIESQLYPLYFFIPFLAIVGLFILLFILLFIITICALAIFVCIID